MATIRDVAKLAGVAPITVSRVINNSGYISDETRSVVEAAIAEMGYVPNRVASSLRSKRTNTLALIVTDITNPFFTTLARGVEDTASEYGFNVIFCNTDESVSKEQKYLQLLLEKQVDGVLLVPACSTSDSVEMLQKNNTPVVVLDRRVPGVKVDIVRGDSEGGAYQLVKLLLSLGHRRIAVLSGPPEVSTSTDRVLGYQKAMKEAGVGEEEQMVYYGEFTQESGYTLTVKALALNPRPTALFAANNFITIGCMKALEDAGLKVPDDMALVGFDQLPLVMAIRPFYTEATQPAYQMGKEATELLLARLQNKPTHEYMEIVLPSEMIVRQSSGAPIH